MIQRRIPTFGAQGEMCDLLINMTGVDNALEANDLIGRALSWLVKEQRKREAQEKSPCRTHFPARDLACLLCTTPISDAKLTDPDPRDAEIARLKAELEAYARSTDENAEALAGLISLFGDKVEVMRHGIAEAIQIVRAKVERLVNTERELERAKTKLATAHDHRAQLLGAIGGAERLTGEGQTLIDAAVRKVNALRERARSADELAAALIAETERRERLEVSVRALTVGDPDVVGVRAHCEYQAMLANLSDVQARCGELLEENRALKRASCLHAGVTEGAL